MPHQFEVIPLQEQLSTAGGIATKRITLENASVVTISGSVYGHASVLDADHGIFTFVAPNGQTLYQQQATGVSRLFSPQTVSKEVSFSKEIPPGVYVAQVQGTNKLSGGSVTISWNRLEPIEHPEEEQPQPTGAAGGAAGGAAANGITTAGLLSGSLNLGGFQVPKAAAAVAAIVLTLAVGVAAAQASN